MTINNNTGFSTDSPITHVKSGSNGLHSELSNLKNNKIIDFETTILNHKPSGSNSPKIQVYLHQNDHHSSNISNSAQTLASSDSFISEGFSRHNDSSTPTTPELYQPRSQEYNSKKKKRFSEGSFLSNGIQWLIKTRQSSPSRNHKSHSYHHQSDSDAFKTLAFSDTFPSTSHKSMPTFPLSFERARTCSSLGDKSSTTVNSFNTNHSSYDDYKKQIFTIEFSDSHNFSGKLKSNNNTLTKIPNQKCQKRLSKIFKKSKKQHPLLATAIQALESMKYNDAIDLYSQVLMKYPNSYSIRCDRAYASYQVEDWERALSDLNFAILKKPRNPRAYTLRGEIYRLLESFKESLMDFNQSLKLQPKNIHALRARAEVFYSINHYNDAILDLNLALEIEPCNVYTISRRAKVYCSLGFYGAALLDLNKALEIDGSHAASILANRGEVYQAIGRNDLALLDLNEAIIRGENGESVLALERRGFIYRTLGREDDALTDFEKILQIHPRSFIAHKNIGEILYNLGEYEDALVHMNIALQLHSNNETTLIKHRGEIYQKLEYYEDAITDFNLVLSIKPDDLETLKNRGEAYRLLQDFDRAENDFTRVLIIDPTDVFSLTRRGEVYRMKREGLKALQDLDEAINQDPDNIMARESRDWGYPLALRGAIYRTLKSYTKALLDLDRAIENIRDKAFHLEHSTIALYNRGAVYNTLGKHEEALIDLNRVLFRDPHHMPALCERSITYEALGRTDKALADIDHALRIDHSNEHAIALMKKLKDGKK
ncbi:20764_t:CDS:2 [Dentiscutata erythropus]|uniref:20764_t:CDS:1 n=1 Tax=Dentiscutata erythropus TaxID=1348616 RepID=A0A9N9HEZ9_9GLOM|nr:20764_t:CDS:2 [Dentiscutata erythropus]